jgi:hypothetical protein
VHGEWWEWLAAILSAVGAIVGSAWSIKQVVAHEQQECDARLDAFREGLDRDP